MALLELEETVGRFWHRLVGEAESYPRHPEAAVELAGLRGRLAVLFRGLGGEKGVRLAACGSTISGHRLSLRQRLGLGTERWQQPSLNGETLLLPERLDYFPDSRLNERHYLWLAAFFAHIAPPVPRPGDSLQADILMLRAARRTTMQALNGWPGLWEPYAELSHHRQKAATRLKFDLDLAPEAVDNHPFSGEYAYPEWDYSRGIYHPHHCRVIAEPAGEEGEDWRPDAPARRRIRLVRRQFEALRPRREIFPAQNDGHELDLAAVVRSRTDLKAGGAGSERVYLQARNAARDLAVAVLIDVSLSTDSWVDNHRVLDVEKEGVSALIHGLAACGDDHAVFAFTSRKRHWVRVQSVKHFDEPLSATVLRRIQALKPGYYTRIGAALRYTAERLSERPNRHRLILLLTDGKPNDLDHYEGRYGVEDTRKAIQEARQKGLAVFGITVDKKARDYFPYLFGRGSYAIVGHIARLPAALPLIYRQLVA